MKKNMFLIGIFLVFILLLICILMRHEKNEKMKNYQENIYNYNNPYVPVGFKKVETQTASWEKDENGIVKGWNNGLVIEDEKGNQFVWVPCTINNDSHETVIYSRYYDNQKNHETVPISSDKINIGSSGSQYYYDDDEINQNIKENIEKYGGFYIGRYEVGDENGNAVIKENVKIYNNIDASEADSISKKIIDNQYVKTNLVTSYCYDTAIVWMSKSEHNFFNNQQDKLDFIDLTTNKNDKDKITGTFSKYDINNINNLFINQVEWTTEKAKINDITYSIARHCLSSKMLDYVKTLDFLDYCLNVREQLEPTSSTDWIGFRVILIIK